MSIPTSGSAALLVVVMLALSSCGDDDAAPSTQAGGSGAVETVTQTATATATAPQDQARTTTGKPATTEKTQTQKQTTTRSSAPSASAPSASTPKLGGACEPVEVGARDGDVDSTYARIDRVQGVSCALAAEIAAQWGQQQMGIGKALLPLHWECTKGNVCSSGSHRVSFTLVRPQE